MPSRRKCSIERALVLLHFGCLAVSRLSFTRTFGTPRQLSSIAAESPTGPPPTMSANVSVGIMGSIEIRGGEELRALAARAEQRGRADQQLFSADVDARLHGNEGRQRR